MQLKSLLVSASLFGCLAFAAIGDLCSSGGGVGTCETTSWCSSRSGSTASGLCPRDPSNVKCCFGPKCSSSSGSCTTTTNSQCASSGGHFVSGQCPGPSTYKCCTH